MNKRAMREAVEKCVDLLGPEILLDCAKFKAAVLDLLPGFVYQQERDWLFICVEMFDLGPSLLNVPPACRSDNYNSLYEKLKEYGLSAETSDAVMQAFTGALKWNIPSKFPDGGDIIEGGQACRHGDIDFIGRRCRLCNQKLYGIFDADKYIAYGALNKNESGGVLFSLGDYGGALVLPEHLHAIGDCAFNTCKRLREVVFPSSLTSIGRFAFEGCACLKSLELPDSLRSIGKFAFADCASLRSVKLPASLKAIEQGVFSGCSELDINIPASVTSIADDAFAGVKQISYGGAASGAPWGARKMRTANAPTPPGGSGGSIDAWNYWPVFVLVCVIAYWLAYNASMQSFREAPSVHSSASNVALSTGSAVNRSAGAGSAVKPAPKKQTDRVLASAKNGDADARYEMGNRYYSGIGAVKDLNEAVKWYKKAAHQGHAGAMYKMGVCYSKGLGGLKKDYDQAVKLWTNAQKGGSREAAQALADIKNNADYQYALGRKKERAGKYKEALAYYDKAAKQGHAKAVASASEIRTERQRAELKKANASASLRSQYANLRPGERFMFGSFPQSAGGGEKPITWRVLRRESNALLVISERCLAAKPYDNSGKAESWADCSLRKWLNSEFLNRAFTDSERSLIKTNGIVSQSDKDRVFLLSGSQASELFADMDDRMAKPTDYAVRNGVSADNGYCWWWLRDSRAYDGFASCAAYDGGFFDCGITDNSRGVRPALRIAR